MPDERGYALSKGPAAATACPKCRSPMRLFDGADIRGIPHRGLYCDRCGWFKGQRGRRKPGGRPGHGSSRGLLDEPYEGRLRPQDRRSEPL